MTPIERAARALLLSDDDLWPGNVESVRLNSIFGAAKHDGDCMDKPWTCNLCLSEDYKRQARAVIESLREPTEEMIAATGRKAIAYVVDTLPDEAPRLYWMSMIDAILKEGDEGIRP